MSIAFDCLYFMDLVTIPTSIKLSHWIGVGSCGWYIYINVVWTGTASWALMNKVPNPTSDADAIMLRSILQTICTMLFISGVNICMFAQLEYCLKENIYHWLCFWLCRQKNRTHHYRCKESYRLRDIVLQYQNWWLNNLVAWWFSSISF